MNTLTNLQLAVILAARSPADRDEVMRLTFERVVADRQGGLCYVRVATRDELVAHGGNVVELIKCIRIAMDVGLGAAKQAYDAGRYGAEAPYAQNIAVCDKINSVWRENFADQNFADQNYVQWQPASIVDV